jgi:hypothetical protein
VNSTVKSDKEMERFIALGTKIAARLKKHGVDMKLHIEFKPFPPEPRKRRRR